MRALLMVLIVALAAQGRARPGPRPNCCRASHRGDGMLSPSRLSKDLKRVGGTGADDGPGGGAIAQQYGATPTWSYCRTIVAPVAALPFAGPVETGSGHGARVSTATW